MIILPTKDITDQWYGSSTVVLLVTMDWLVYTIYNNNKQNKQRKKDRYNKQQKKMGKKPKLFPGAI